MTDKILVVDDEDKIREVLVPFLRMEGFETSEAGDGESALRILTEQSDISLVLLDWMMPGLSGIALLTKMREITNVPIIFLTARTQEVDKLLGLEIGADDYITKPFSIREVAARIRAVLRRSGRRLPMAAANNTIEDHAVIKRDELMIDLMRYLNRVDGTTFVIVTHDPNVAAKTHRVLYMDSGQIIQERQVQEMAVEST